MRAAGLGPDGHPHRATRDVDLLGVGDPSEDRIREIFAEMIALEVADDGVVFDVGSLAVGPIRDEQEYGGWTVTDANGAATTLPQPAGFGGIASWTPTSGSPAMFDGTIRSEQVTTRS